MLKFFKARLKKCREEKVKRMKALDDHHLHFVEYRRKCDYVDHLGRFYTDTEKEKLEFKREQAEKNGLWEVIKINRIRLENIGVSQSAIQYSETREYKIKYG